MNIAKNTNKRTRVKSALELLFIGDALSMPVHWFYRPMDILRTYPPDGIRQLEAAPEVHPSSIMSLHSTSGGGRDAQQRRHTKQIVGEVILKGRAHHWEQKNVHYHQGLAAGENTLNTWCAHLLIKSLCDNVTEENQPVYNLDQWLASYIDFMTAEPPLHPDTYAESYHRGFFANLMAGKSPAKCGAITHDTPSMGALVTVAPLALALLSSMSVKSVQAICCEHVWATHPDDSLMRVVDAYVRLMSQLLEPDNSKETIRSYFCEAALAVDGGNISGLLKEPATEAANINRHLSQDMMVVGGRYSLACYIQDSWPSVCYLSARHFSDPKRGLLINTNLGGENAHRGSVLGTLLGLASGESVNEFYRGLARHSEIDDDINKWLGSFYPLEPPGAPT